MRRADARHSRRSWRSPPPACWAAGSTAPIRGSPGRGFVLAGGSTPCCWRPRRWRRRVCRRWCFVLPLLGRVLRGSVQGGWWVLWWQIGVTHFAPPGEDTSRYMGIMVFLNGASQIAASLAGMALTAAVGPAGHAAVDWRAGGHCFRASTRSGRPPANEKSIAPRRLPSSRPSLKSSPLSHRERGRG